jgi:hypothetical protein
MEASKNGEQLFTVTLIGQPDRTFKLVCHPEDLESFILHYKKMFGRPHCPTVTIHEPWDQELVDRLER